MTINFTKVFNDYGKDLPASADDFFNDGKNEVTRKQIRDRYGINSNHRGWLAFRKEYEEFVAKLVKENKERPIRNGDK